jgi:hypothetical protein
VSKTKDQVNAGFIGCQPMAIFNKLNIRERHTPGGFCHKKVLEFRMEFNIWTADETWTGSWRVFRGSEN